MKQKVALVTGGASGIGEEVCRLLAEHQFLVAVCDIDREKRRQWPDRSAALVSSAMSQAL